MFSLPDSLDLTGRVAIVTGAGCPNGIGYKSAISLGELGASLFITSTTDRILSRSDELVSMGIKCVGYIAEDLSDQQICQKTVEMAIKEYGRIDILVNNAGMINMAYKEEGSLIANANSGNVLDISLKDWHSSHFMNLDTTFLMTKFCISSMIQNNWGRIINISSTSIYYYY